MPNAFTDQNLEPWLQMFDLKNTNGRTEKMQELLNHSDERTRVYATILLQRRYLLEQMTDDEKRIAIDVMINKLEITEGQPKNEESETVRANMIYALKSGLKREEITAANEQVLRRAMDHDPHEKVRRAARLFLEKHALIGKIVEIPKPSLKEQRRAARARPVATA